MKSIFIKLYGGLILSLVLAALLAYGGIQVVNQWRLKDYIHSVAGGTFSLIAEGVSRHKGIRRQEWLAAVERITGLEIYLSPNMQMEQDLEINTALGERSAWVHKQLADKSAALSAQVQDIDEPLARITALLILNELGRFPKSKREQALMEIQKGFGYPVMRLPQNALGLSQAQRRRLERGDVFVNIEDSTTENPYLIVYAPYGKSRDVLVLGPVPLFRWYPPQLIWTMVAMVLLAVGLSGYLLVHPLERRLLHLMRSVDRIGKDRQPEPIVMSGDDGLSLLARHINDMSERIHGLLKNQKELTHAVSHELRTPIARLRFRLELLEVATDDADRTQRIKGMEKDIVELNSLVDEILTYARLEASEMPLDSQAIEVDGLLAELSEKVAPLKGDIQLQCESRVDTVYADAHYLHRALQNLLGNALRFAEQRVQLSVVEQNGMVSFSVADDGEGVPEDDRSRIFEPFARIDSSRNRKSGGYGLGLAITRQIARWHGGDITLSRSELGGALFVIKIPVKSNG